MTRELSRIALLGGGPDAIRVVQAVRDLAHELGAPLRTIAIHGDRDRRACAVRESDERVESPPGWPGSRGSASSPGSRASGDDLARLGDALARARADALWSCAPARHAADLARLCHERSLAYLAGPPALVALLDRARGVSGAGPAAALRALALDAGWPARGPESWESGAGAAPGPGRRVAILVVVDRDRRVLAPAISDITLSRGGEPVVVECPPPWLAGDTERALREAAIRLATRLDFAGVASIEAEVAPDGRFALAGIVPGPGGHPAIEAATGLDLFKLALQLARGATLVEGLPAPRGHAFAVHLTREDPERGFAPTAGVVELCRPPSGLGLRFDPAVASGDEVGDPDHVALATLVASGNQRAEALARLHRGLRDTTLVVRGGATNKASLLALCSHPVVAHPGRPGDAPGRDAVERLLASARPDDAHLEIALFAVAIAAYHAQRHAEAERFFHTANHGRPRLGATGGHRITLRHGGASYTLAVAQIAAATFRIDAGAGPGCDVRIEHRGPHELRLGVAGSSHRVHMVSSATHHVVEVDGVPRQITVEDSRGVVRAPSPAVVLRVAVAPGELVAAGQLVVVLEAMKMEIAVTAPIACRIREVLVIPSVQVDLDAPLAVYEHIAAELPAASPRELALPADPPTSEPRARLAGAAAELRRLLLGYDADAQAARAIVDAWKLASAALPPGDAELANLEVEALATFADVQSLLRRQPADPGDGGELEPASAQEHLHGFLRALQAGGAGLPPAFLAVLERTVARHGVTGLSDSPALRDALQRIFCAHERAEEQALAVAAILDRRLGLGAAGGAVAGDAFHVALNQVITTARRRFPAVHELALEVRHALFDEPMFERTRAAIYQGARSFVERLEASPAPGVRAACVDGLIACTQPLLALLVPRLASAGPEARAAMLEVLTRRYYRSRGVTDIAVHES
ncbi:MAG TPA: biotin/lipoyl-containing protein, partial [Kofleriaceae bacterium]|nr:biotin/lipoyl-containing protein [Kofleriaceae bacterium]